MMAIDSFGTVSTITITSDAQFDARAQRQGLRREKVNSLTESGIVSTTFRFTKEKRRQS